MIWPACYEPSHTCLRTASCISPGRCRNIVATEICVTLPTENETMKLSKVAAAVAALLATDAKPTEAQIMAACIAADKKGKDEGGLGPVEIENKAKDEKEKAEDAKEFGAK